MLKRLFLTMCTLSFASHSFAEASVSKLYIPFGLMYYNLDSDRGMQNSYLPELGLGYRINDQWATEVIYAMGDSSSTRPGGIDVDINQTRLDLLHFYTNWKGLTPYSVVGIGQNDYDSSHNQLSNDDDRVINIGAGLMKAIDNNWSARADIRDMHSLEENQNEYAVHLMVQYQFAACATKAVVSEQATAPAPAQAAPAAKKAAAPAEIIPQKLEEKMEVSLSVNFDTGSSVVKPQYHNEIQRVADYMKKYPDAKVTIEGHTDDRGDATANQKLSERRANAIRNDLIKTHAADASHLTAKGYGESKPIADNKTTEGQFTNRRVIAVFE